MSIPFRVASALLGSGTGSGDEEGGGGGGEPGIAPGTPNNFSAVVASSTQLDLSWTSPTSGGTVTYYRLDRSTDGVNYSTIEASLSAATESYNDTGLTTDQIYYYRLYAGNSHGESAPAEESETPTAAPPGAPDAPSDLAAAMQATNTTIRLTWTDNSGDEDQFNIYRSVNGGAFSLLTTTAAGVTQYDDAGLTLGNDYSYKVSAENTGGESLQDGPATVTNLGGVAAPTGLTATVDGTSIDLAWSYDDSPPNGDEDGFIIYRDDSQLDTVAAGVTTYEDTSPTEGVSHVYEVSAQNGAGEGTRSNSDTAALQPTAPSGFAVEFIGDEGDPESGIYRFTWVDNSNNEALYTLERDTGGGFGNYSSVAADVTQADVEYTNANGHTWRVHADGNPGVPDSDPSNSVVAVIS